MAGREAGVVNPLRNDNFFLYFVSELLGSRSTGKEVTPAVRTSWVRSPVEENSSVKR
jgi:hypothetical protein